jgi:hypothetical protein
LVIISQRNNPNTKTSTMKFKTKEDESRSLRTKGRVFKAARVRMARNLIESTTNALVSGS